MKCMQDLGHVMDAGASQSERAFCHRIASLALGALHAELSLYPKPGLVSLVDNGSHADMSAPMLMRSLFSLRHYFAKITQAGIAGASFAALKRLGQEAETRMLRATGGINTHRGAIFCLGLLCAAIGRRQSQRPLRGHQRASTAQQIRHSLLAHWGADLAQHAPTRISHGAQVALRHAVGGAREEAALGFPALFEVAYPRFLQTLDQGRNLTCARIDALFALMAHIDDTNIYYRGGRGGDETVKALAKDFLARGGSAHPDWRETALACHRVFIAQGLSPGGAADLLAATCLLHQVGEYFQ